MTTKVLAVAPAWVGDMVMAHTLVPGLTARGAEVHFLAPRNTIALASRMPGVAGAHPIDTRHGHFGLGERRAAARRLRSFGFARTIVLPGSFKSALTPLFAGIPRRTGFRGELRYGLLNDMRRLDVERWPRTVDRFAALADVTPSRPRLRADPGNRRRLLRDFGLGTDRPIIALCPGGAYGPAKRWPVEHFAALARRCAESGTEVWILGGRDDAGAAAHIARHSPAVDLVGRTGLVDAVDLLSAASAVVANDSGAMHMAAALDVPVAALFGTTSASVTPPLSPRAQVIERQLACRPCQRRECPLGHLDCLRGISSQRVFDALVELGAFDGSRPAASS